MTAQAFRLLVIDDNELNLKLVSEVLSQDGLEITTALTPEDGLEKFASLHPRIVLLDLVMPGIGGMEVLERMIASDPAVDVIFITANYTPESAVEAIQKGATDYFTKPLDVEKLRSRIKGLLDEFELRRNTLQLDHQLVDAYQFANMVGRSPLMLDVFAKIRRVAPHYRTVLVRGATGTGKELAARALYQLSPASAGPFIVCNCSALVETLVESELFGYVKGAFTGATQDKKGLFEHAHGGAVFLDEIGELSPAGQAKLLRVLQNREIQRVGSSTTREVDVRVIAATNRDLKAMVKEGLFREDLYYRLAMVEVSLPRLADRKEDLPLLQRFFLQKFSAEYGKPMMGLARRAQIRMAAYPWPGNIRELENVIGNACMMADGPVIDIRDLPETLREVSPEVIQDDSFASLEEMQKRHVLRVLEHVDGNKTRAAEILGIGRATIYQLLSKMEQ
jgi:DNA-binding NtrC family response regulator